MGLRLTIESANWFASVLEPRAAIPQLHGEGDERDTLRHFMEQLRDNYFSTERRQHELNDYLQYSFRHFDARGWRDWPYRQTIKELRRFFPQRPWTALIIPSGQDNEVDSLLSSREFLRELVDIRADDPGLILQLEAYSPKVVNLTDIFPAIANALANATEWPGILIWKASGDSVFLPLPVGSIHRIEECARWIFSHLATSFGRDLGMLKMQYMRENQGSLVEAKRIHILHLSDLHIGSREAGVYLPAVQGIIRDIIRDVGNSRALIPVVTGDLMDSPKDEYLDSVRSFMAFLNSLGTQAPIVVLGNHDVRKNGYKETELRQAMMVRTDQMVWFEEEELGFACFNSVAGGYLAQGSIGDRQFVDVGAALTKHPKWDQFPVFGVLHHHPLAVKEPDWYNRTWYERVLGNFFEKTDKLIDADEFVTFAEERGLAGILHGHKHIPRIDLTPQKEIPVFGCGSSVGKVPVKDGGIYMSINIVTVDQSRKQISGRLMAVRTRGGGLVEQKSHESVYRGPMRRRLF